MPWQDLTALCRWEEEERVPDKDNENWKVLPENLSTLPISSVRKRPGKGVEDALLPPCVSSRESRLSSPLYSRPNNIVSFSVLHVGAQKYMPFRIEARVCSYETRRKRNSGKGVSALCP